MSGPEFSSEVPQHQEESATFDRSILHYIQQAAATGLYEIRGLGAKRRIPHFDDLVFLGASLSRYPLEGYREVCRTNTVLGSRFASKPLESARCPPTSKKHWATRPLRLAPRPLPAMAV